MFRHERAGGEYSLLMRQTGLITRVLFGNDYAYSDCYTIDFKGRGPMKAYSLKGRA